VGPREKGVRPAVETERSNAERERKCTRHSAAKKGKPAFLQATKNRKTRGSSVGALTRKEEGRKGNLATTTRGEFVVEVKVRKLSFKARAMNTVASGGGVIPHAQRAKFLGKKREDTCWP